MRSIDKARRRRKKELVRRRPAPPTSSSSAPSSRRGPAGQEGLWPLAGSSLQGNQGSFGLPEGGLGHDAQMSMYQADEIMGTLLEDEMCNFAGDDGQMYFV